MMAVVKRYAQKFLARHPQLYRWAMQRGFRYSLDRMIFLHVIRKGDVVFDVGANFGRMTSIFSDIVGSSGHVHAFEPVPPTFEALSKAVSDRSFTRNVSLNNLGLSDEETEANILVPSDDFGQASMVPHLDGSWTRGEKAAEFRCRFTTLDKYSANNVGSRLNFIKIDVEGAELRVLGGGAETIRKYTPVLYLEVHEAWTRAFGYSPPDLIAHLLELGYSRILLSQGGLRRIEKPHDLGPDRFSGSADLLCAIPGAADDKIESLEREFRLRG